MTRSIPLALLVALGLGCSDARPAPTATPAPTTNATPAPPSAPAEATPPPGIPEADVRALVDAWTTAQNRGDFAAYSALYATRFQGVRRNADRTRSFDRAGWMKDRERMFRRPMVVSASDVAIHTGRATADVTFTQRWSSGTYADEGPKRLVLVQEGSSLKISVEEMLAAERQGDVEAAIALGTFVALPTPGGALAILGEAPAGAATGAPRLLPGDEPFVVTKAPSASMPPEVRALVGRTVTVIERSRACEGQVESISVAGLVIPHFGTVEEWNGTSVDHPGPALSASAKAAAAWELATKRYYVATIRSTCAAPVAATLARAAGVTVFSPREPRTDERAALATAFERTRRFLDREAAYRTYLEDFGDTLEVPQPPTQREGWRRDASTVVFESGGRRVATVVHNAQGCGQFDVSAWAGFELAASPTELRETTPIGDYIAVMAVFDVDGDGALEAIVRRDLASFGVIRLSPGTSLLRRVDVDYLDCPC